MGALVFASVARMGRIVRVLRLLRLQRLSRMPKLFLMDKFFEDLISESATLALNIGKGILCLMSFAHLLACIWFSLGTANDSWMHDSGYDFLSIGEQYAYSLHWAMTQFLGMWAAVQ